MLVVVAAGSVPWVELRELGRGHWRVVPAGILLVHTVVTVLAIPPHRRAVVHVVGIAVVGSTASAVMRDAAGACHRLAAEQSGAPPSDQPAGRASA